jgi:plasmid stabilization system protein ParE
MRLEFSNRAVADLRQISGKGKASFGEVVALELEARIRLAIKRIVEHATDAPRVDGLQKHLGCAAACGRHRDLADNIARAMPIAARPQARQVAMQQQQIRPDADESKT